MKFPINVSSDAKQVNSRLLTCGNCGAMSQCSVISLETDVEFFGLTAKKLHKHIYAVCPDCGKIFKVNKEDYQ